MLRKIAAIAWKDTIIRFSSRSEILFFLVLPIVFTLILGRSGAGGDSAIALPVVDEDGSALSAELITTLESSDALTVSVRDRAAAEQIFEEDQAPAILTIPAGFEAALLAGETADISLQKGPNNANAEVVDREVSAAVGTVSQALTAARSSVETAEQLQPFDSETGRQTYFSTGLEMARAQIEEAPERVVLTQPAEGVESEPFDLAAHQSAGQLITWVFIPLLGVSGLLAFERSQGTLRRVLTTPTSKMTFLLGTLTGQYLAGLVQMALLVGFGILVMGVNWGQSPLALAVMLVSFGLASVALGTMLATFVKTDSQANSISIMAGMVMALLGGCWFPLELFPESVRTVVRILPTTWAMEGLTDLVLRGKGLVDILPNAAVLIGFSVVFLGVGVWRFRYE
ncbi:MAG: ABC transporter permease [Candidatus Promineifilaceae bacterium]